MGDIIIKKIKKGGHGHHGGAWKVAYADFVTAMMAFFLLMWILGMSDEEQLQGLADYFTPSEGVIGETGSFFGKGPHIDGLSEDSHSDTTGGQDIDFASLNNQKGHEGLADEKLNLLGQEVKKSVTEDNNISKFKDNIMVEQTSDGLLIQIVSKDTDPALEVFAHGSTELTEDAKKIIEHIVKLIYYVPNYISVVGHTDSTPISMTQKSHKYGNWELSADRANSTRRFMIESGLDREQIARVIGKSSVEPMIKDNPRDIRNKRIGITILKPEVFMPDNKQNTPEDFFENIDIN